MVSILLDPISVVARMQALEVRFPGGVDGFAREFSNGSFRRDAEITAVSYLATADAQSVVSQLVAEGLNFGERVAEDIAVFDAAGTLWLPCLWLEIIENPDGLPIGRLVGSTDTDISVPDYFDAGNPGVSIASLHRVGRRELDARLSFSGLDGNVQLLLDRETGRVLRGGRPLARQ